MMRMPDHRPICVPCLLVQMNIRDAHGFTALHLAAGMGHANVVAYLLEKGANASIKDQVRCPANHSTTA